jgi:hypothetical protein
LLIIDLAPTDRSAISQAWIPDEEPQRSPSADGRLCATLLGPNGDADEPNAPTSWGDTIYLDSPDTQEETAASDVHVPAAFQPWFAFYRG